MDDTFTTAANLGKFNNTSQTGLNVHTATDLDYYAFKVAKSAKFSVSVTFAQASGNLDLYVYDAQQNLLAGGTSLTDNESLTLSLVSGKQYYLKVLSPEGSLNSYDLAIAKMGGKGGGVLGGGRSDGTPAEGYEAIHGHAAAGGYTWLRGAEAISGASSARGATAGFDSFGSGGALRSMHAGRSDGADDSAVALLPAQIGPGFLLAGTALAGETALDIDMPLVAHATIADELAGHRELDRDADGEADLRLSDWLEELSELLVE